MGSFYSPSTWIQSLDLSIVATDLRQVTSSVWVLTSLSDLV